VSAQRPSRRGITTYRRDFMGYSEHELLEKWARDSKILDIFEGTQQIQQLIVARRLLDLTSIGAAPATRIPQDPWPPVPVRGVG
jgi:Acyl-CoA dehydrogenase, C-terminal domain